ncbi:MAG: right-handed parallel beta-helix repeat-containing protein [Kiritimatiellae bacterium]|nr:right-handed parallel beta-helix repeat-containing protein [Kiritimatiellia bacterium]
MKTSKSHFAKFGTHHMMGGMAAIAVSIFSLQPATSYAQGSLTPPGAPAPTMKTLSQVEPRTPISSAPFDIAVPGSYYMTTNLTGLISIGADGVSLDLMGFSISVSEGAAISMSGSRNNIRVHNGVISAPNGNGIDFSSSSLLANGRIEEIRVNNCGGNGITVNANDVFIDLAGHTLSGPGGASGYGIYQSGARRNLTVKNGQIVNWSGSSMAGVFADGINVQIHHLQVVSNYTGIATGIGYVISDCTVYENSASGIMASFGAVVSGCVAYKNGGNGIDTSYGGTVSNCASTENAGRGIYAFSGNMLQNCTATRNENNGVQVVRQ